MADRNYFEIFYDLGGAGDPDTAEGDSSMPDPIGPPQVRMMIGRRLTLVRKRLGKSQQQVADFLGISRTHVSRIELGKAELRVSEWCQFCKWTGTRLLDLHRPTASR